MDTVEADKRLTKAKAQLLMKSPFIAFMCLKMKHSWSDLIPTAATNGLEVLYNPEFFLSLSFDEQVFTVAHETWHPALDHFNRVGDRDKTKWNYAGDFVINLMLQNDGFTIPEGSLISLDFANMSTEQVYDLLPDVPPQDNFIGIDILDKPAGMDQNEYEVTIKTNIISSAMEAEKMNKDIGSLSAELRRYIDKIRNPTLPWHTILINYMTEFIKDDYSWRRPNRRYQPDFYLPSQHSPAILNLATAVDTSVSVTKKEFTNMMSELQGIKDIFNPQKMELVLCDARIKKILDLTEYAQVTDAEFRGGGGTSIVPVLEYYEEKPPEVLVWFSDLEFHVPPKAPDYPIIWVCTSDHKPMPPEWGTTIYLKS